MIMDITKEINILQIKTNVKDAELARRLSWLPQSLYQKKSRNVWKFADIEAVAAALGCHIELNFIDNETGEKI